MIKYFLFFNILILYYCYELNSFEKLLKWGKEHQIYFNEEKLYNKYKNRNNQIIFSKDSIKKGEILLKVPKNIIYNIENIKNFNPNYENKIKNYLNLTINEENLINHNRKNDSLLTFITYLLKYKKKYKNNPIKILYKPFFENFENNFDNFPLFYNEEQLELFRNTSFGSKIEILNDVIAREIKNFSKFFNIKLDKEKYSQLRILISGKSYKSNLIPFYDLFTKHPINYNTILKEDENYFYLEANDNIEINSEIIVQIEKISNSIYFIFTSKIFKNFDYEKEFFISVLHPYMFSVYEKIDPQYIDTDFKIDLINDNIFEKSYDIYLNLVKQIHDKESNEKVLELMKENLETYLEDYNNYDSSEYNNRFIFQRNINIVRYIINFEKNIFINTIKNLEKNLNEYLKTKNKKKDL